MNTGAHQESGNKDRQEPHDQSRRDFLKTLVASGFTLAAGLFFGSKAAVARQLVSAAGTCSSSFTCSGGNGKCGSSYNCSGRGADSKGKGQCGSSFECSGGGGKCGSSYSCSGQGAGGKGKCGSSFECGGGGGKCGSSYNCAGD